MARMRAKRVRAEGRGMGIYREEGKGDFKTDQVVHPVNLSGDGPTGKMGWDVLRRRQR